MPTYVIGDLQGCLSSFKQLAAQLPAADRYIFVGDLVNRGFESLATLRHVKARVERGDAVTLLGNHDLHLLAAAGVRPLKDADTLQKMCSTPPIAKSCLRCAGQPLRILKMACCSFTRVCCHRGRSSKRYRWPTKFIDRWRRMTTTHFAPDVRR